MTGLYVGLAALALSAAGTGASAYNQNQNLKKQDNQAAASIIRQGSLNSRAGSQVAKLNSAIAKSNPDDATKAQTAAYIQALTQAQPTQSAVNPGVRGASKRYGQATQDAQKDVGDYARSTASNLAATSAPQIQRINEGNAIANTASNLGLLSDSSASEQGLLKTQLAGDAPDPWLGAVSGILTGAGSGLSTYAGSQYGNRSGVKKGTGAGVTADSGLGGNNPYLA